jgi:small subunit ribosomal protein S6
MRDYEVVYIFKSTLGTEDIESRVQTYHEKILAGPDAAITAVVHWGKRELAYPIEDEKNGYYVVAQFSSPPEVLTGFERALKLDDDLLRHLLVISEGELPTPPADIGGGPGRDDDRDDSDDVRPKPRSQDDSDDDSGDDDAGAADAGDDDSGDDDAGDDDSGDDDAGDDDSDDDDSGDDDAEQEA